MALTPDDIVNKTFETTRFRDGYDQEEVDNFLDEVVGEYRRLLEENEQLKARVTELESGAGAAPAAESAAAEPAAAAPAAQVEEQPATVEEETAQQEAPAQVADQQEASVAPAAVASSTGADSLLQLAQRVHDEHIAEGEQRKAALVAEGESFKLDIERAGEERKAELDAEFEEKTATLKQQKADLEAKIDELKSFERDYRLKLRGYIESQLRDLDRSSSLAFGGSTPAPNGNQQQ